MPPFSTPPHPRPRRSAAAFSWSIRASRGALFQGLTVQYMVSSLYMEVQLQHSAALGQAPHLGQLASSLKGVAPKLLDGLLAAGLLGEEALCVELGFDVSASVVHL